MLVASMAAVALLPVQDREADEAVRGITISTHGIGRDWGTDVIVAAVRDIKQLGANWVTTHPYAGIRQDGTVRFNGFDAGPPAHVVRPIREAHRQGMKILIKPHLAHWGSGFSWRGAIEFDDDAEWDRFFTGYRRWIVAVAKACKDADGFVIGTELDKTLQFEDRWREIIAAVRQVTGAPLTYAANWTDYRRVSFWDAVDVIGIQAYFPIADEPTTDPDALAAGWHRRMADLRAFSQQHDRKVVFTELGYNRRHDAAVRPWEYRMDGADALPAQAVCTRVALRAIAREPVVVGAFLWKWFPRESRRDHNFKLQTPALRDAIRSVWSTGSESR